MKTCLGKVRYKTSNAAARSAIEQFDKKGRQLFPYQCPFCSHYHLTSGVKNESAPKTLPKASPKIKMRPPRPKCHPLIEKILIQRGVGLDSTRMLRTMKRIVGFINKAMASPDGVCELETRSHLEISVIKKLEKEGFWTINRKKRTGMGFGVVEIAANKDRLTLLKVDKKHVVESTSEVLKNDPNNP